MSQYKNGHTLVAVVHLFFATQKKPERLIYIDQYIFKYHDLPVMQTLAAPLALAVIIVSKPSGPEIK
jgi:hypothetical protein